MSSDTNTHVDPGELILFCQGSLVEEKARMIRAHLESCGACRAEMALAQSFQREEGKLPLDSSIEARLRPAVTANGVVNSEGGTVSRVPRMERSSLRWTRRALLAAAVLVLMFAARDLIDRPDQPRPIGELRAPSEDPVWDFRLAEAVGGELVLNWPVVEGARSYELRVLSSAGSLLWSRQETGLSANLTRSELPSALLAERVLFLRIAALLEDGRVIQTRPRPLPD